jgi:peptidyl-prolyl cis-trans isomerase C
MQLKILIAAIAASVAVSALADEPTVVPLDKGPKVNNLPPDTVLVKRGDTVVTAGDFMAQIEKLPEDQRFAYRGDVERITSAVSGIYVQRVLAQEAREKGIDKEPDVQRRLKLMEEALLAQIDMERFEKAIVTPDFEARAREIYKASQDRYVVPESFTASHIMVGFQGRTEDEAKRRAEEARAKLLAGENFARIAREYSNDPMVRSNDGHLEGSYAVLPPLVADAAHKLPLNQVSDLIRANDGYHILIVKERVPSSTVSFEQAKTGIIRGEKNKYRREKIDEKLGTITKSKDITIYTDELASLVTTVDRDELQRLHTELAEKQRQEKEKLIRDAEKKKAAGS